MRNPNLLSLKLPFLSSIQDNYTRDSSFAFKPKLLQIKTTSFPLVHGLVDGCIRLNAQLDHRYSILTAVATPFFSGIFSVLAFPASHLGAQRADGVVENVLVSILGLRIGLEDGYNVIHLKRHRQKVLLPWCACHGRRRGAGALLLLLLLSR